MNTGLMWFDGDPKKSLLHKIREAGEYYRGKNGRYPQEAMVSSKDAAGQVLPANVQAEKYILPSHVWVGMKSTTSAEA